LDIYNRKHRPLVKHSPFSRSFLEGGANRKPRLFASKFNAQKPGGKGGVLKGNRGIFQERGIEMRACFLIPGGGRKKGPSQQGGEIGKVQGHCEGIAPAGGEKKGKEKLRKARFAIHWRRRQGARTRGLLIDGKAARVEETWTTVYESDIWVIA